MPNNIQKASIFLDESGDIGWTFNKPYRQGGSSRYLTIAAVVIPSAIEHLPRDLISSLYKDYGWKQDKEKKWAAMRPAQKLEFAKRACQLVTDYPDIKLFAITVKKEQVFPHIRNDGNKIYNYMIRLLLLDEMCEYAEVAFHPDPRSIKVESGNSLHHYLEMLIAFDKASATQLTTKPRDSDTEKNIQFADMLSGVFQSHFEDNNSDAFRMLRPKVHFKRLYF